MSGLAVAQRTSASNTSTAALSASNSAAANATALQAAITAMSAAGGGTVYLPAGTFNVASGSITLANGVSIVGSPPQLTFTTNAPLFGYTFTSGSVLVGPGSGNCFIANNTAAGSAAANFAIGALATARYEWIAFKSWDRCFDIGAVNQVGGQSLLFNNIFFDDIEDWCINLENSWGCKVFNLFGHHGTASTANKNFGALRIASSVPNATASNGQNLVEFIQWNGPSGNIFARGVVLENVPCGAGSTDYSAILNDIELNELYLATYSRIEISQTGTYDSGVSTTNITVTDGTKFPVGMPCIWTATPPTGMTANIVYFVLSQSSNIITLGTEMYGATGAAASAVTFTGTSSGTLKTYGRAPVEIYGRGQPVTSLQMHNLQFEGNASTSIVMHRVQGGRFDYKLVCLSYATITRRRTIRTRTELRTTNLNSGFPNYDDDATSNGTGSSNEAAGMMEVTLQKNPAITLVGTTPSAGSFPGGLFYDATLGQYILSLNGLMQIMGRSSNGLGNYIGSNAGIGEFVSLLSDSTSTSTDGRSGLMVNPASATRTKNLQAIAHTSNFNSVIGQRERIHNSGTANLLIVGNNGTQTINNVSGFGAVALLPGTELEVVAVNSNPPSSGTYYWLARTPPIATFNSALACLGSTIDDAAPVITGSAIVTGADATKGVILLGTSKQACTMSNGVGSFAVTNSGLFAIGQQVVFDASANGFTVGTTYYVVALADSTHMSVSATLGGSVQNPTGSTAVNVYAQYQLLPGQEIEIFNSSASALKVYPPSTGAKISVPGTGTGTAGAAYSLTAQGSARFKCVAGNQWLVTKSA